MLFDQAIDIPEALSSGDVTIALIEERARYSLRLKSSDVTAVKKASGLKLPTKIGGSSTTKDVTCLKLGPDEWLVIADMKQKLELNKQFAKISNDYVCSVTEVSHRNVAFDIKGEGAVKMVNVGCSLDLSIEKFPIGKVTRTIFESASIILLRTGEQSFHIECWRSFGPYLRDYFARVVSSR